MSERITDFTGLHASASFLFNFFNLALNLNFFLEMEVALGLFLNESYNQIKALLLVGSELKVFNQ